MKLGRPTAVLSRGASGGLAGASIERTPKHQHNPRRVAAASLFMMMRVDQTGPSRNLINSRCLTIKISANAQMTLPSSGSGKS